MDDILNLYTVVVVVIMLYYLLNTSIYFLSYKEILLLVFSLFKVIKSQQSYYLYIFYIQGKKSNILITTD